MRIPILLVGLLTATIGRAEARSIHVVVALCDNVNQGIVPVPKSLGNGQDKDHNLYWGAAYGVRTWFDRSKTWVRQKVTVTLPEHVLERCIWKHTGSGAVLVADAYDGAYIQLATETFFTYTSGNNATSVVVGGATVQVGGGADLIAYVGHDGLMDFAAPTVKAPANKEVRRTIILACISQHYFREPLRTTGASPMVWTTGLMAPEAYTLEAAISAWVGGADDAAVREKAAAAYHAYQKCGLNAARKLLVTGW